MPSVLSCCPEAALCLLAIIHKGTASQTGTTGASERLCKSGQPFQVLKWTCRSLAGKGIFWDVSTAYWKLSPLFHTGISLSLSLSLTNTHTHTHTHWDTQIQSFVSHCVWLSLSVLVCLFHDFLLFLFQSLWLCVYLYLSSSPMLLFPVYPFH